MYLFPSQVPANSLKWFFKKKSSICGRRQKKKESWKRSAERYRTASSNHFQRQRIVWPVLTFFPSPLRPLEMGENRLFVFFISVPAYARVAKKKEVK